MQTRIAEAENSPFWVRWRIRDAQNTYRMKVEAALHAETMAQQEAAFQRGTAAYEEIKKKWDSHGITKLTPKENKKYIRGFTLTLSPENRSSFEQEKSILERSLDKIWKAKGWNMTQFYACLEKHDDGHLHAHAIFQAETINGNYPRKDKIQRFHGLGIVKHEGYPSKECPTGWSKGTPLAWHNYISGAGKEKFGFVGTPWM